MEPFQQLLKRRMDRKTFLRTVGLLVIAAVGLSALMRTPATKTTPTPRDTYGA